VKAPLLTHAEMQQVKSGRLVFRPHLKDGGVNTAVAVQRVRAPVSVVWGCLLDFERYPSMVDDVCAVDVYEKRGAHIKVALSVGYSVIRLMTCLHHTFSPALGQLTWSLDSSRSSSFNLNDGFWLVRADPSDPSCSLVFYSIAVELKGWMPGWVNTYIGEKGIPRAVAWVQREAERRAPAERSPSQSACTVLAQSSKGGAPNFWLKLVTCHPLASCFNPPDLD